MACSSGVTIATTVKVSRPGFYLTTLWFFVLPFGGRDMFGSWVFWLGCFYVCFPLGLLMYGWNDLMDIATDQENPRKDSFLFGARLRAEQTRPLVWRMALVQLPFLPLFVAVAGAKMLLWFAAMLAVNALYNGASWGFKNRPGWDLVNQAGYLLVFVLSCWLNDVPQLPAATLMFSTLFAMHSHLFGQILDVDADRAAGRRTTAGVIGVVPAKWLLACLLVVEVVIVWPLDAIVACFLAASALLFATDAGLGFRERPYPGWIVLAFFLAWNAVAGLSMVWLWQRATLVS
jgi:4-hydroxybenzoate polyprenyltransferase